jgi:enamine deaminase RidA (YjgF/YER057c/UK114 family)
LTLATKPEKKPVTDVPISTGQAPAPAHTFFRGGVRGGLLQVSGQGPVDPEADEYLHPGREGADDAHAAQGRSDPGGRRHRLRRRSQLRVNLTTLDDFVAMNEASEENVGESRRTCSPQGLAIRDG